MCQSPAPDVTEFSTDNLPARDRWPIWCEVMGRKIVKLQLESPNTLPFRQTIRARELDGLTILEGSTNGMLGRRTKSLLADSNDDLLFVTNLSGSSLCSQVGRELRLDAGEATFISCGEVGFQEFRTPTRWFNVRIPRRALAQLVSNPEDWLIRSVAPNAGVLRLLTDYALMLSDNRELATPHLREIVSTHVYDLLALLIGGTRDAIEVAKGRGLRAARLNAVKADIVANLDRPRFSPHAVAARQGISPRYLRKLFEAENTSFSDFVLEQRLDRAHRMLTDAKKADRTISTIAFAVGFGDLSYFNRTFRRHYGAAPSEVREQARRDGGW